MHAADSDLASRTHGALQDQNAETSEVLGPPTVIGNGDSTLTQQVEVSSTVQGPEAG